MKKSLLLCSTALVAILSVNAGAMDFSKDFYGKANVSIGYSVQILDGDLKDLVNNMKTSPAVSGASKLTHGLTLGIGYNFYYKLSNVFHPFIGLNIEGRIPLKTKLYSFTHLNYSVKFIDFFAAHAKLGTQLILSKNIAIAPYYLAGFNVAQLTDDDDLNERKIGLSTGAGIDTILFEKYSIGVEYKYSMVKNIVHGDIKAQGHQIGFKFGYQFL